MKRLFKSVVTLSFITIVCIIAYFLFSALKRLHIQSWFILDPSVVIGFLSGLILTCLIALINFHHALREHARERAELLDGFVAESESFLRTIQPLQSGADKFVIPDLLHPELELALERLDASTGKLMRAERISLLKSTTIEKRGKCASKIAQTELAFDRAFVPFAESCNVAFRAHGILPYLKDEAERQKTQEDFLRSLRMISASLQKTSNLHEAYRGYRTWIDRFLGVRQSRR